jgi:fission 1 protein
MLTDSSPLKPAELQVLRAQYEKEGEHVGVQTKFNFAWVSVEDDAGKSHVLTIFRD